MAKAVIFDMDGVLYDSPTHNWQARIDYVKEKGGNLTFDDIRHLPGRRFDEQHRLFSQLLKERFGIDLSFQEFYDRSMAVREAYMKHIEPKPGARDLLEDLVKNKMPLGLATSNSAVNMKKTLDRFGFTSAFSVFTTGEEVKHAKPHPEIYALTAEKMGFSPEDIVAIEDARSGAESAKAAGMKAVGLLTNWSNREDLKRADHVISSLAELNYEFLKSF